MAANNTGSVIFGYANNGSIENKGLASILTIRNTQGLAKNHGHGNIVFGDVRYSSAIKAEENTKGALCGGISDNKDGSTWHGDVLTNGQGTLTVGIGV